MLSYCLTCRKDARSENQKIAEKNKAKSMFLSK